MPALLATWFLCSVASALAGFPATCHDFLHNVTASAVNRATDGSPVSVNGTWALSFRYCAPLAGAERDSLQVLLHGASYDKSYWDWPYTPSQYSYVQFAARRGYHTLSYDRLGSGASQHPDPIAVVQAPLQIAIAVEVIALVRARQLLARSYSRIVHVGHSFGSVITTGVLASSPSSIDIAILTGYAHHPVPAATAAKAVLTPAQDVDPARFASLDPGYLTTLNITTRAAVFYAAPGTFSPYVLQIDEDTKGTFATGELSHNVSSAPSFAGHVGAFIGNDDILNCDPGCTNVPNEPGFFPAATYDYTIIPDTGHCLNLHYTAQHTYSLIHDFLERHGF